jgi:DNA-binding NarL/FixJ family response regulator
MRDNTHKKYVSSLLTDQDMKVLKLVVKGQSNKEIAANLTISHSTVKRHLESIFYKLHLKNRVEAAVYGVRTGIVP